MQFWEKMVYMYSATLRPLACVEHFPSIFDVTRTAETRYCTALNVMSHSFVDSKIVIVNL